MRWLLRVSRNENSSRRMSSFATVRSADLRHENGDLVTRRIYSKLAHLPSSRGRQLMTLLPSGAFYPPVRPIEMRLRHRTLVASVGTISVLARAANPILELA